MFENLDTPNHFENEEKNMAARTVFFLVLAVMIFVQLFITFRGLSSATAMDQAQRSEEHTSELQSHSDLVCRLLLEKKKSRFKAAGAVPARALTCASHTM